MSFWNAVRAFEDGLTSIAFVVDDRRCLQGVLTDGDCLRRLSSSAFDSQPAISAFQEDVANATVGDMMSESPALLRPGDDLFSATQRFLETGLSVLPVTSNDRLVGGLARRDLLIGIEHTMQRIIADEARSEQHAREATDRPSSIEGMQRTFARHTPEKLVRIMGRSGNDSKR